MYLRQGCLSRLVALLEVLSSILANELYYNTNVPFPVMNVTKGDQHDVKIRILIPINNQINFLTLHSNQFLVWLKSVNIFYISLHTETYRIQYRWRKTAVRSWWRKVSSYAYNPSARVSANPFSKLLQRFISPCRVSKTSDMMLSIKPTPDTMSFSVPFSPASLIILRLLISFRSRKKNFQCYEQQVIVE